jgi:hypothetical protein
VLQQVIFERFAAQQFTATALLEPLGGCLPSLEFGHGLALNKFASEFAQSKFAQSISLLPNGEMMQLSFPLFYRSATSRRLREVKRNALYEN